ncbi:MAG TPA: CBS domain-containing protein [Ktedonobacterales bacterium]|nr:CBS domain-containing protein [Ktedonobacterales bacterium]
MMRARDIMTHEVITIGPEATLHDAARLLSEYNISGAPVVDGSGQMIGIITEADLLGKEGKTVADIMTARVTTAQEDTPVEMIAQILTSNRFKRLPVVRSERVVGIVSRADIVRMMASRWVCGVCGAEQAGRQPMACESCGATASAFERDLTPRMEMSARH